MKFFNKAVIAVTATLLIGFQSQANALTIDFDNNNGGGAGTYPLDFDLGDGGVFLDIPRFADAVAITSINGTSDKNVEVADHGGCEAGQGHCLKLRIDKNDTNTTSIFSFVFGSPLALQSFDLGKLPDGVNELDLTLEVITDGVSSDIVAPVTGFAPITANDLTNYNGGLISSLSFSFTLADPEGEHRRLFIDNIVLTPSIAASTSLAGFSMLLLGMLALTRRARNQLWGAK